jgi:inward rectifier potassium channel
MVSVSDRFLRIKRLGVEERWLTDVYHRLLVTTWTKFSILICLVFLVFNAFFACLYWAWPNTIGNSSGTWFEAFAFSVQTFSTIGYGVFHPNTTWAHSLVVLESMGSMLATAVLTGLTFAKFSKPSARIVFSNNVLITQFDSKPTLMIRIGNLRGNQIVEANIRVVALIDFVTPEGEKLRRQIDLKLVRNSTLFFALTWTILHEIDKDSPYFGLSQDDLVKKNMELAVSVIGYDGTLSQTVHANAIYEPGEFVFGKYFADMIGRDQGKVSSIDYNKFHLLKV